MSLILNCSLFFTSFLPLWISVLFIDGMSIYERQDNNIYTEIISVTCILIGMIVSCAVIFCDFRFNKHTGVEHYIIQEAKEEKIISIEFLLSYILPLYAFDFTVWKDVILFLIFFIVFAVLCILHNHFSVNILLEFMGYRYYNCIIKNIDDIEIQTIVLSHTHLNCKIGNRYSMRAINNECKLCVRKSDG